MATSEQLDANREQRRRLDALRDRASGSTRRALAMQIRQLDSQYNALRASVPDVIPENEAQFTNYVKSYQDLQKAYQNRPSSQRSQSMAEWGKQHWTLYGQKEKRSLDGPPPVPAAPVSQPPKPQPPAVAAPEPPIKSAAAPPVAPEPERAPAIITPEPTPEAPVEPSPVAKAIEAINQVAQPEDKGASLLTGGEVQAETVADPKLTERLGSSILTQPDPFDVSLTPSEQEAIKAPQRSDKDIQQAARTAMTRERRRKGRQSTILTSSRGVTGKVATARRPQLMSLGA